MKKQIKRWIWLASGWAFIGLGILGLFLPFLQGILFLLVGLLILSSEYVWAHRLLQKLRSKFPKLAEQMHNVHERFRARWYSDPTDKS